MPTVVVDAATRAKLAQFTEPVELLDESGRPFGRFTPLPAGLRTGRREPQISEEELDRREQEGGGRPLAAILADLRPADEMAREGR